MADPNRLSKIEHFFVLVLENRSFDHMFGGDKRLPDPRPDSPVRLSFGADDRTKPDPPHEFRDVCLQVTGRHAKSYSGLPLPMNGFAASASEGRQQGESQRSKDRLKAARGNGDYALRCQLDRHVPALRELARNFAVCTHWHSSMPGPTWPNRFFFHAATSGGLDNSPSDLSILPAIIIDDFGFDFERGTIYDRIDKRFGRGKWRIYHGDPFPQVLAIKSIVKHRFLGLGGGNFSRLENLEVELQNPQFAPKYVFIEPDHDISIFRESGRDGDSQHPPGLVSRGERLIKKVYEAVRHSPLWEKSLLIVTYDEHGGFFDRVKPEPAVPPGDDSRNQKKAEFPADFDFKLLGPRVPAVIVSPWIEPGTIDDDTLYDHTSILRTVEERFGLDALTKRDKSANSFAHLLTRQKAVEAPSTLPEPEAEADEVDAGDEEGERENTLSGTEAGVLRIAMSIDHILNLQRASLAQRVFEPLLARIPGVARIPGLGITTLPLLPTREAAGAYIARVAARVAELEPTQAR